MNVAPPHLWPPPPPAGPAPLDQPQYHATIGQAASRFWRKYAVFSGRASRTEFWWWALISFVVSLVLQLGGSLVFGGGFLLDPTRSPIDLRAYLLSLAPSLPWDLVVLVPTIALTVRRLHDINRSGWWYLLTVPSYVGLPLYLVGLASVDPERVAVGDFAGVAVGPLAAGLVLTLVGTAGSITLLVFLLLGPDPRGARFDRRV